MITSKVLQPSLLRRISPHFLRSSAIRLPLTARHFKKADDGLCGGCRQARRSYFDYSAEFYPVPGRQPTWTTPERAVEVIESEMCVYVHSVAGTPLRLIEAMCERGLNKNLKDVEIIHMLTEGPALYTEPQYDGIFRSNNMFVGQNVRDAVQKGRGDYLPVFLSETPLLFRSGEIELDVAMVTVSPPDKHGFCTLGTSVDCTRAALQNADCLIGSVNENMPRTFGDGVIHISHFDQLVECNDPLPELKRRELSDVEKSIAKSIADNLVSNGATIQTGIGNIPDAVLHNLKGHRDLGVHSEMFSDGIVDLVESGALTNAQKKLNPGKIVGGFCSGTRRLYDFLDNNPFVVLLDISYVNDTDVIKQQPKFTAINSCIEVDLTGQIVADSIGHHIFSGVGGQIDFIRGAAQGNDGKGKPIIATPSTNKFDGSNIVSSIKKGAGVVTTRAHAHYIVTEYGIAYLFGKNLRQRAYELIQIAHPNYRESLEKAAYKNLKCMPSP